MGDSRIRVGFLVNYFFPAGLENFVLLLLNNLDRQKFQPYLYIIYKSDPDFLARLKPDITIFHLNRTSGNDYKCLRRLANRICEDKIRVLQVHNWGTFLEGLITKFLCPHLGLVHLQQGMEYELTLRASSWKNRMRSAVRNIFVHFFDAIVGCSGQTQQYLRKKWGARNAGLIYNSVDTRIFSGRTPNNVKIPGDDGFRVCTIGRIVPVKNFPCLFQAIDILHKRVPEVRLYHIGEPHPDDRIGLNESLRHFRVERGLEDNIFFLGKRNDLPQLLGTFDVFALTSFSEGLSFSLLEAQASGLPAVVTRVGGNPEVVQDGVNGYLVPSDDANAVAEALYRLYRNPKKREEMGRNARRIAQEKFDVSVMVKQYQEIYQRIVWKRTHHA